LALISSFSHKAGYGGEDEKFGHVVYYDYIPPSEPIVLKDGLQIVYHACEWDQSYLSKNMASKLKMFLAENNKIEYAFIKDM